MFLGRVVGEVWATKKAKDLLGLRLLVVEALDERREPGAPKVTPVIAADPLGADVGEHVVVAFGKAARVATLGLDGDFAFEAAIVGIVDDFDVPDAPESWRLQEIADVAAARAARLAGGASTAVASATSTRSNTGSSNTGSSAAPKPRDGGA